MRDIVGHMKSFLVIYILFALALMKLFFNIVVKRLAGENYGFGTDTCYHEFARLIFYCLLKIIELMLGGCSLTKN